ncbi:Radial spokehead-like protein like protein, partial [Aduncisulcus paluster]
MEEEIFEAAKKYLMQKGVEGRSLFEHLSDVVLKLFSQKPDDPYETLEDISRDIKESAAESGKEELGNISNLSEKELALLEKTLTLFKRKQTAVDENGSLIEDDLQPAEPEISDLLIENHYMNLLGRGLPKIEAQRVFLSMRRFAQENSDNITSLRFFGKFICDSGCYYVLEGVKVWKEDEDGTQPDYGASQDIVQEEEEEEEEEKSDEEEEKDKKGDGEEEEEEEEEEKSDEEEEEDGKKPPP